MTYVNFKEVIIDVIKSYNINFDDITQVESVSTVAESTFIPRTVFIFKMVNGEKKEVTINLSRELIEDLKAHGLNAKGDIEDFNKLLSRKVSLNKLLGDE